ncbi:MAG: cobalamin-dependent protein [Deltaproteobacteria bacterium]|nr:cobalamin-dependent protein [Deltaproteobacteria bacterium]
MSKVLLVQNAYHYQHHTHLQPLGLMYVASALRQKGHEVGLLDMKVEQMSMDAALDHVGRFRPDVLGVSGMSFESASMYEMAKRAKASWPEMTIVAGGPHATNVPEDALKQVPELDYICLGEGEQTSVEMMDQLTNGRPMDKVNGLAFMADGRFHQTPARDFIEDLDAVPFPAWDLVPLKNISSSTAAASSTLGRNS